MKTEEINTQIIELEKKKINLLKKKQKMDIEFSKVKSEFIQNKINVESKITIINTQIGQLRRQYTIKGYKIRRKLTTKQKHGFIKKNGNKCSKCLTTENLMVGHKIPLSHGGTDDIENLMVLCIKCELENHRV